MISFYRFTWSNRGPDRGSGNGRNPDGFPECVWDTVRVERRGARAKGSIGDLWLHKRYVCRTWVIVSPAIRRVILIDIITLVRAHRRLRWRGCSVRAVTSSRGFPLVRVSFRLFVDPITVIRAANRWSMFDAPARRRSERRPVDATCVECVVCARYYFSRSRAQIGYANFFFPCALHEKWKTLLNDAISPREWASLNTISREGLSRHCAPIFSN